MHQVEDDLLHKMLRINKVHVRYFRVIYTDFGHILTQPLRTLQFPPVEPRRPQETVLDGGQPRPPMVGRGAGVGRAGRSHRDEAGRVAFWRGQSRQEGGARRGYAPAPAAVRPVVSGRGGRRCDRDVGVDRCHVGGVSVHVERLDALADWGGHARWKWFRCCVQLG